MDLVLAIQDWQKAKFFYEKLLAKETSARNLLQLYERSQTSKYEFDFKRLSQLTAVADLQTVANHFY